MHELSMAMSIVELAQEEAEQRKAQVTVVHLRLGALAGVVKEALLSCYEMACFDTPLQSSRLVIEDVPAAIFCASCQAERPVDTIPFFLCPVCGAPATEIVRGKELEVFALEIQELEEVKA